MPPWEKRPRQRPAPCFGGPRGNSGVILSLLFRGIAKSLKDRETIDGRDLAIALDFGVAAAYKAVMKPAEGTHPSPCPAWLPLRPPPPPGRRTRRSPVLEAAIREGQEALADTINQNPVLKKAGVVDAGGKGFLVILQGMLDSLRGEPMPQVEEESAPADKADFVAMAAEDITFAFDTVFIVRKHTEEVDLEPFRTYLNSIGDSLVIGEDDTAFKVHVHTNTPGAALTESQKYGTLELAKIENMRTQADDLAAGKHVQSTDDLEAVEAELEAGADGGAPVKAAPEKKYGFVAVCAGQGLEAVFRDLGVDGVISGGQTMNPSTEDILREVDKTPAEIVYVLPNNKNIIMAAEQCVRLCEDKRVVVLPSKTVPQGISAMLAVDLDAQEEDNTQAMTEALQNVHTAEVTYAARDSDFGGFTIKQGDYLALEEHQLFGTDQDLDTLLTRLAQAPGAPGCRLHHHLLWRGCDGGAGPKMAADIFTEACPSAEINLLPGGQPVYYYMISAE
mgnify:CR=1 FL=1